MKNIKLSDEYYLLMIENMFKKEFHPGNFLHIKIENHFLRRPFSVSYYTKKSISVLYKIVGEGTNKLSKIPPGEKLDIIGPLGNSFPIFKNKNIALIGGGSGIGPLIFLAKKLKENRNNVFFFYGASKKENIFFQILPLGISYIFATDDGSFGIKGDIFSTFLKFFKKEEIFDIIYGVGPKPLLIKLSNLKTSIPIFISVENYMACGMGLCYGCVIKVKKDSHWEFKKVCKDGPIFEAREVIWD